MMCVRVILVGIGNGTPVVPARALVLSPCGPLSAPGGPPSVLPSGSSSRARFDPIPFLCVIFTHGSVERPHAPVCTVATVRWRAGARAGLRARAPCNVVRSLGIGSLSVPSCFLARVCEAPRPGVYGNVVRSLGIGLGDATIAHALSALQHAAPLGDRSECVCTCMHFAIAI